MSLGVHIFWDNSNVWGGAQEVRKLVEPEVPWVALRVYFKNIYRLIAKDREILTKVMAGSVPPECEELWRYAEELGFDTDLLYRVEDDKGREFEQAVDEMLHLKMANAVLDYDPPQIMTLLSGDSKKSDFGTSFPSQVERALKKGWSVELYTFAQCYSEKKYKKLLDSYGETIQVVFLDPYYRSLTFVKGGEYYRTNEEGEKLYFTVKERIVDAL